jgi:[ribosomal protein S5]-alanine N-acetyltransferase
MLAEGSLTEDRVTIAPLMVEHVTDDYVAWLNDPEVTRFTEVSGKNTLESTRSYVQDALRSDTAIMCRILCDETHHIGNIRLSSISARHQRAIVALMLGDRTYWGKGLATSAIRLITRYGFEKLHLRKLTAGIIEANVGSRRAFEKAGYHIEASLRQHYVIDGETHNDLLFAKFNPDFPTRGSLEQ